MKIKHFLAFYFMASILICSGSTFAQVVYSGGDGTSENPWKISTPGQLNAVRNHLDSHFILINDIDLGLAPYNQGEGWEPIGTDFSSPFTGTFDGDGYVINGLFINRDSDYQGLFGYTDGATIKNLGVTDVNITGARFIGGLVGQDVGSSIENCFTTGTVTGRGYVGGLMGSNGGSISNCSSTAAVLAGELPDGNHGGLVGYNGGSGTIMNSYTAGDVTGNYHLGGLAGFNDGMISYSYASGKVTGNNGVGGLVGYYEGVMLSNCYATGEVTGDDKVGGLVGSNWTEIINSYSTGPVSGASNVGGLIGENRFSGTMPNSFFDSQTTGQSDVGKGTPKTTTEMIQQATFVDWDFHTVWGIDSGKNYGYPYLLWQEFESGDLQVDITPANAWWRRVGETNWRQSGPDGMEYGLEAGSYALEFSIVAGWNAKGNENRVVHKGELNQYPIQYTRNTTNYLVSVNTAGPNGTVIGGNTFVHNTWVTVRAIPKRGFAFSHWTENGQVIYGAGATYKFYATGIRNLVAHFREVITLPGVMLLLLDE
ncbi:GLUG motif-containing protein [Desulfonatronum sp. SC1]|uniref:GLUG motif-containing protein n=1 Tax=Desulfonatronum sp. SC1 TaxID=2109626 RepID=UPI000D307C1E|nr:GLUG motif-containing protein [Desulfonatronum sp. SC1]PTN31442.1 hypothetical protein C6366_18125 [Desulfonatronum sp. SC1]